MIFNLLIAEAKALRALKIATNYRKDADALYRKHTSRRIRLSREFTDDVVQKCLKEEFPEFY